MKRIALSIAVVIVAGAFLISAGGASNGSPAGTYKIEFDNAFGLVTGADFKVEGVRAGEIKSIDLDQKTLHAVITVSVTQKGFGEFHADAFCQSRPQSLIGEYFVDCSPGTVGKVLPPGSTIPVQNTQSTIAADLLNDIMRLPYRQRFSLIINELGAAVAARSEDLKAALRRAVPALNETDNLLTLLANDSATIQKLTVDSDEVVTELANNSKVVQRWIQEAGRTAADTAVERVALQQTFHKFPAFLEALKPNMQALGAAATAQIPSLTNLNASAQQLSRLFTDLPGFANASKPAISSLGQTSVIGKKALTAAKPTIADLSKFAKNTPELAQNLAIVLPDLDNRNRAVERDPRSPGGKGYTGFEALLQYVFNQALAINTFTSFGHQLTVDAFYNQVCSPYATQQSIANNLAKYQAGQVTTDPRSCYAFTGPNQPGLNETDPSNPSACVPDPGGTFVNKDNQTINDHGPQTSACKLQGSTGPAADHAASDKTSRTATTTTATTAQPPPAQSQSAGSQGSDGLPGVTGPVSLSQTVGSILSVLNGTKGTTATGTATSAAGSATGATGTGVGNGATGSTGTTGSTGSSGSASGGHAQQLLNYLLAP